MTTLSADFVQAVHFHGHELRLDAESELPTLLRDKRLPLLVHDVVDLDVRIVAIPLRAAASQQQQGT